VKKGRHRRFEEARALKRTTDDLFAPEDAPRAAAQPCAECGAEPGAPHAAWCLAEEEDDEEYAD
jgi:hypothetical protein